MSHNCYAALKPMTRDRWLEIVTQSGEQIAEPLIRRQFPRSRYHAGTVVSLVYSSADGADKAPQELTCSVLDISLEGLMLCSHCEIPPYTPVNIEWYEDDGIFVLSGSVERCTGTVGTFKVGIDLQFPTSQRECPEVKPETEA